MMTIAQPGPVRSGLVEWPHRVLKPVLRRRLGRRWDVHVTGLDHVPPAGPVILASNHVGWLDGPVTVITSDRAVHALVKHESFEGGAGRLLRLGAQIKLHRGRTDAAAVRTALRVLRAGQVLLVYPEGKRGDGDEEGEGKRVDGDVFAGLADSEVEDGEQDDVVPTVVPDSFMMQEVRAGAVRPLHPRPAAPARRSARCLTPAVA